MHSFTRFIKLLFIFFFAGHFFLACSHLDVFEKNTPIPAYKWMDSFAPTASFDITDTLARYNIYMVLRHTDYYKYSNIWLNLELKRPGDSAISQKIECTLADDKNGWEGTGINDIWEVRKLISPFRQFRKKGLYTFTLRQIMRDNPLSGIMSTGIRIEKVPPERP
jgi:gliding motility-associated lipoprotein GldH